MFIRLQQSFVCLVSLLTSTAQAQLLSPFPSRLVEQNISIPNAGMVLGGSDSNGAVWRGMQPIARWNHFNELLQAGMDQVLIFKVAKYDNEGRLTGDVGKEVETWRRLFNLKEDGSEDVGKINLVNFPYYGFKDFKSACELTLDAIEILHAAEVSGDIIYFHCTVGEDRTGYLAGVFQLLYRLGDVRSVFEQEMCAHGYGAGNPSKPANVVAKIHKDLTPLYLKMAYLIHAPGGLNLETMDRSVCERDEEELNRILREEVRYRPENFKCSPQDISTLRH